MSHEAAAFDSVPETPENRVAKFKEGLREQLETLLETRSKEQPKGFKGFVKRMMPSPVDLDSEDRVLLNLSAIIERLPKTPEETQALIERLDSGEFDTKILTQISQEKED